MSKQLFKVTGDLQITTTPEADGSTLGRVVFADATTGELGALKIFGGGPGNYRLILDTSKVLRGISFRTSNLQGATQEGGTENAYPYTVDIQNNYINLGNTTNIYPIVARYPTGNYDYELLKVTKTSSSASFTSYADTIAHFGMSTFQTNQALRITVGQNISSASVSFGYRNPDGASNSILGYGFIGFPVTKVECLQVYRNGDVEIPTKLKATTVEATNWIGLPAVVVPSAQLLPLTLNSTDGHVGINTTSPTEALDVQGNIKASGFITGQLTSGAQPGITGVGVLGGLDVTGDADFASGVTVAHDLSVSGAVMASEAHVLGDLSAANATVSQVLSVMGSIQAPEAHILGTVTADRITATHYDNLPVQSLTPITLDATNKRVGIDKASPQEALDVVGNIHATGSVFGTQLLSDDILTTTITASTYNNLPAPNVLPITLDKVNNRVGINKTNPTAALHVDSKIISESLDVSGTVTTNKLEANIIQGNTAEVAATLTAGNYTTDRQSFRVQNNGKVDINWLKTDFPPYQLNVDGNIQVTDQVKCTKLALGLSTASNVFYSAGTPEGVQIAPVGSLWMRKDGAAGTTLYTKVSGTGNTGWQTLGGTSQIGSTVLKKITVNKAIATTPTEVLSFVLPYIGTYEIMVGHRCTASPVGVTAIGTSVTVTPSYPTCVRFSIVNTQFATSNQEFATILYTTTTAGATHYFNATSPTAVSMLANETFLVATYKGVFP